LSSAISIENSWLTNGDITAAPIGRSIGPSHGSLLDPPTITKIPSGSSTRRCARSGWLPTLSMMTS
jgi:hypothetical protein